MISFDEFLKQDDEEKYNNAQMDIFEIQALKDELKNRDIYISKLGVAYSKEIERLNNIIKEVREKLLCYGETFDLKVHQQMQKELLKILDEEKV